jgi:hypothetical protein
LSVGTASHEDVTQSIASLEAALSKLS